LDLDLKNHPKKRKEKGTKRCKKKYQDQKSEFLNVKSLLTTEEDDIEN
jgi:hypothetical protein